MGSREPGFAFLEGGFGGNLLQRFGFGAGSHHRRTEGLSFHLILLCDFSDTSIVHLDHTGFMLRNLVNRVAGD